MSLTNIALNSRSLNGVITISDGTATLENGDLNCEDINSNSLSTSTINTTLLNCLGKFECNSNGPYTIPTLISTVKGLLISYGNTLNNGSTDFTNFQSTYTSTKGGFNFWNKSSTQTLTNLAIIDNSQTYFKSQLIGCTSENPVNPTSIVNKTYVDTNFVDLTNAQNIGGSKTFNATMFLKADIRLRDILAPNSNYFQIYQSGTTFTFMPLYNSNIYRFVVKNSLGTNKDALEITNNTTTSNCDFISNQQSTFNNFSPISNTEPTIPTHLTTKNYTDIKFQTIANMVNYVDITTNQTIGGDKTFTGTVFLNDDIRFQDIMTPYTKQQQIFQEGSVFTFFPLFNLNTYRFVTKSSLGVQTDSLEITNTNVITNCNFLSNTTAYLKNSNTFGTLSTDVQTVNSWLDLKFRTRVYNLNGSGDHTQVYMIGGTNNFVIYPIPNSGTIELYAKNSVGAEFNLFSFTALLNTCRVPLTCLQQATFNTVAPLCSIAPSVGDSLCNRTYVDSVAGAGVSLAGLNTWTNTNTFSLDIIVKSAVYLKSISGGKQATFYLDTYGTLAIGSDNVSGNIQMNTQDSLGNTYNRIIINENEINTTVPLSLTIDYTYYNPVNFGSNRLGYSTSNTGTTNTLTTATGNNSGQLNLPCGSWNITYTAIITVITGTLTSLNSLEVFIADSFNADLNIIGLDVLNYYKISTISIGQQIKISASGNIISYNNVNTQYNLRIIPIFVAGAGGLTFTGKISATRNA